MPHLLLQPYLDQRLIRHVARIGRGLDGVEQVLRQPQRDGVGRGFQVGQDDVLGFRPIDIVRAVVGFPERAFLGLRGEGRNGFKALGHRCFAPSGACRARKSPGFSSRAR